MREIFIFTIAMLACSCTTIRQIEKEKITVRTDTVVHTDTIENRVVIPGETRVQYLDRIDTVFLPKFMERVRLGTFSLDTLRIRSSHASAWFGVRDNRPFFGITQDPIELITQSYIRRITVLEQQLKEREKVTVKRYLFYENPWFWIWCTTVILFAGMLGIGLKSNLKRF